MASASLPLESHTTWYWPEGPYGGTKHPLPPAYLDEYMRLFADNQTWPEDHPGISVFGMSSGALQKLDDARLRTIFRFLRTHNLKFATNVQILRGPPSDVSLCPDGTHGQGEGYGYNVEEINTRLRSLVTASRPNGEMLDYAVFDEPYAFGHVIPQTRNGNGSVQHKCQMSATEAGDRVAAGIQDLRATMYNGANIRLVETEPLTALASPVRKWLEFGDFLDHMGGDVPQLRFDIQYDSDPQNLIWPTTVQQFASFIELRGIATDFIVDGNRSAKQSDAQWIASARARLCSLRKLKAAAAHPYDLIFQSWDALPAAVIPHGASDTILDFISAYQDGLISCP